MRFDMHFQHRITFSAKCTFLITCTCMYMMCASMHKCMQIFSMIYNGA